MSVQGLGQSPDDVQINGTSPWTPSTARSAARCPASCGSSGTPRTAATTTCSRRRCGATPTGLVGRTAPTAGTPVPIARCPLTCGTTWSSRERSGRPGHHWSRVGRDAGVMTAGDGQPELTAAFQSRVASEKNQQVTSRDRTFRAELDSRLCQLDQGKAAMATRGDEEVLPPGSGDESFEAVVAWVHAVFLLQIRRGLVDAQRLKKVG
jgi:hypothetical protein